MKSCFYADKWSDQKMKIENELASSRAGLPWIGLQERHSSGLFELLLFSFRSLFPGRAGAWVVVFSYLHATPRTPTEGM